MEKIDLSTLNWEKIGVYILIITTFLTVTSSIADIRERVAKLEVKVKHLEKGKK